MSNISVNVSSQFNYSYTQDSKDSHITSEEKLNNIIRSYSAAALNDVEEYVERNKGEYTVYRYIKRSELRAMFNKRVAMARKWIWEARRSDKDGKTGDALKYYYWALLLLRSCPDADLEVFDCDDGTHNMMQYSFSSIKAILSAIEVAATELEMKDGMQYVTLKFTRDGRPLTNFNYRFTDGKTVSKEFYTAKDGAGEIIVPPGMKLSKLKIQAEYECRDEANINPDLKCVIETTEPVPLAVAQLKLNTKNCKGIDSNTYYLQVARSQDGEAVSGNRQEGPVSLRRTSSEHNASAALPDVDFREKCLKTVERVQAAIASKSINDIKNLFTAQGWDMFKRLMSYGNVRLLRQPEVALVPIAGGMVCRSLPMSFSFKSNTRNFTEDVVLYLDKDGKVDEVAFGLEKIAVDDIMHRGEWDMAARQLMVHFLETYKTAYALKRLDYINSIFSNDALIITGSVVYSNGKTELGPTLSRKVIYTPQTKTEYMQKLERCFNSNEYVNIQFADNVVRRSHTNPDIYGIQIKQDYFSSSYGDTGYLFLMIDFANVDSPLIHVRTWQPDLDPDTRDGRIGMADFML